MAKELNYTQRLLLDFLSPDNKIRARAAEAFIGMLKHLGELPQIGRGAASFIAENPRFLVRAMDLYHGDEPRRRRDGANVVAAIRSALLIDDDDDPKDVHGLEDRAVTLLYHDDSEAFIDGAKVVMAGFHPADDERIGLFILRPDFPHIRERLSEVYENPPGEEARAAACALLTRLNVGCEDHDLLPASVMHWAIACLGNRDWGRRADAVLLLESCINDEGEITPDIASHFRIMHNIGAHYTAMPPEERWSDGADLLTVLAGTSRAEEIARYPGLLDRAAARAETYLEQEARADKTTGKLFENLAINGQAAALLANSRVMGVLVKLYAFTDRGRAEDFYSKELDLSDYVETLPAGRGAANFGIDALCAIAAAGHARELAAYDAVVETAVEMLGCDNCYANKFGYQLLCALNDYGARDIVRKKYPDIEARLQAYVETDDTAPYPVAKDRLGFGAFKGGHIL